jgi:hypothetical protein
MKKLLARLLPVAVCAVLLSACAAQAAPVFGPGEAVAEPSVTQAGPAAAEQTPAGSPTPETSAVVQTSPAAPETPAGSPARVFPAKRDTQVGPRDFDSAYALCRALASDYYKAAYDGKPLDLEPYLSDEDLRAHVYAGAAFTYNRLPQSFHQYYCIAEVTTDVALLDYNYTNGLYMRLRLADVLTYNYGGETGVTSDFIVTNENGRLVVADCYFFDLDSYDVLVRGEPHDLNKFFLDDPDIWDDEDFLTKINSAWAASAARGLTASAPE